MGELLVLGIVRLWVWFKNLPVLNLLIVAEAS